MNKKPSKEKVANVYEVKKRFEILKRINDYYREYNNLKGIRRISTTAFESHYGEYLVASKLINEGFEAEVVNKKGYDIRVGSHRIEVKTSRLQHRIREAKHKGWAWAVKKKQWNPQGFDFLVCVACERPQGDDAFLAFSYPEVKERFTRGSWKYQNSGEYAKDYLRLSLYEGGIDAFREDMKVLKKEIELTGKPTSFEASLNENPDTAFKKYSWDRLCQRLR